jgi:ferredoxin-NADP reductase
MPGDIHTATVDRVETLAPGVRQLTLCPDGPPLGHVPGQWLSLRLPVGDKPPLVRAYTLAMPPQPDGALVLLFDRVEGGLGSEYLWTLTPGDTVAFSGPAGNFVLPPLARTICSSWRGTRALCRSGHVAGHG